MKWNPKQNHILWSSSGMEYISLSCIGIKTIPLARAWLLKDQQEL